MIWIGVVALLFWLLVSLDRSRRWPREAILPPIKATFGKQAAERIDVVIPARNEAENLPRTLPSLLQQEGVGCAIILSDDESVDGTATVAYQVATESGRADRLTIESVEARPPGWVGKVWALDRGVAATAEKADLSDWLLLTDADISYRQGAIRELMARARSETQGGPFDAVSVMARLHAESFWERLLIPAFVYFFQLLYPFRRVRDARSATAAAAGGCILIRRSALNAIGGLTAIKGAWIDDVALAQQLKENGFRIWLGFDPGIRSVRRYSKLSDIWSMVARSAYVQLQCRLVWLVLVLTGLVIFVAVPIVLLAGVLLGIVSGTAIVAPRAALVVALAAAIWFLQSLALWPSVQHHRVPSIFSLALPVASVLYGAMTLSSAWNHYFGGGPRWKQRTYPVQPE